MQWLGGDQRLLQLESGIHQPLRDGRTVGPRKALRFRQQPFEQIEGPRVDHHVLFHVPAPFALVRTERRGPRITSPAFQHLCSWENLVFAWRKAARGKRGTASVARFEYRAEEQIAELREQLLTGTYRPGRYVHFQLDDPKPRKISAAPFRDRVVHHALCNLIEPRFERLFIAESYANRVGKGTHRATQRLQEFARRYRYVLRADIVQHFASIDHAILLAILGRQIPEPDIMALVQNALQWLWQQRTDGRLSGRLLNDQGGLAGILSQGADHLLLALGRQRDRALELLFRLVKVDPEGRRHTRQRMPLAHAVAVAGGGTGGRALVDHLAGTRARDDPKAIGPLRLITVADEAEELTTGAHRKGWVNLIHETLMRSKGLDAKGQPQPYWPTFWRYIEQHQDWAARRQMVAAEGVHPDFSDATTEFGPTTARTAATRSRPASMIAGEPTLGILRIRVS